MGSVSTGYTIERNTPQISHRESVKNALKTITDLLSIYTHICIVMSITNRRYNKHRTVEDIMLYNPYMVEKYKNSEEHNKSRKQMWNVVFHYV